MDLQFHEAAARFNGLRTAEANRVDVLTDRAERAEAELERCRRALASSRAQHELDRETLADVREDNLRLRSQLATAMKSCVHLRRCWEKASSLLRRLTPEQFHALKQG